MQPHWPAQFVQWLSDWDIGHQEVVIEVVESEKVDPAGLAQRCDDLRRQGLRIALDDMGAGFNCLSVLGMVRSDYIKVDRGAGARSAGQPGALGAAGSAGVDGRALGCNRDCRGLGAHRRCGVLPLAWAFIWCKAICWPAPSYAPLTGKLGVPAADKSVPVQRVDRFCITDVIESPPAFDIQAPLTLVRQAFRESPELPWCMLTDGGRPVAVLPVGVRWRATPARWRRARSRCSACCRLQYGPDGLGAQPVSGAHGEHALGGGGTSTAATSARWSR